MKTERRLRYEYGSYDTFENGLDSKEKTQMLDQIDKVDGVKWSLGMNSLIGPTFPESMIPSNN